MEERARYILLSSQSSETFIGIAERKAMIGRESKLSIGQQAQLLGISRGSVYYLPKPLSERNRDTMRRLDELHVKHPFMGARQLRDQLNLQGVNIGRKHVKTLMQRMLVEHGLTGRLAR